MNDLAALMFLFVILFLCLIHMLRVFLYSYVMRSSTVYAGKLVHLDYTHIYLNETTDTCLCIL